MGLFVVGRREASSHMISRLACAASFNILAACSSVSVRH